MNKTLLLSALLLFGAVHAYSQKLSAPCTPILNSPIVYSCPFTPGFSIINGSYVKLNGNSNAIVNGAVTDAAAQVVGIPLKMVQSNVIVQTSGATTLNFDGATTSGDTITSSTTIAGYFHDTGSNTCSATTLGSVSQTIGGTGQATAFLGGCTPSAGAGSASVAQVQQGLTTLAISGSSPNYTSTCANSSSPACTAFKQGMSFQVPVGAGPAFNCNGVTHLFLTIDGFGPYRIYGGDGGGILPAPMGTACSQAKYGYMTLTLGTVPYMDGPYAFMVENNPAAYTMLTPPIVQTVNSTAAMQVGGSVSQLPTLPDTVFGQMFFLVVDAVSPNDCTVGGASGGSAFGVFCRAVSNVWTAVNWGFTGTCTTNPVVVNGLVQSC